MTDQGDPDAHAQGHQVSGPEQFKPWDDDHTALVHVLWAAKSQGMTISDCDVLAERDHAQPLDTGRAMVGDRTGGQRMTGWYCSLGSRAFLGSSASSTADIAFIAAKSEGSQVRKKELELAGAGFS